jgi:hypothetical protein
MSRTQAVIVRGDPREGPATEVSAARARQRHDFLAALLHELGTVDVMLNAIDARSKRASPALAARLAAVKQRLTYDPRNIEDLTGPAQLREDLLDLIGRMGTSFQPPTTTQLAQAALYAAELSGIESQYRQI